jgi:hypothetical protein
MSTKMKRLCNNVGLYERKLQIADKGIALLQKHFRKEAADHFVQATWYITKTEKVTRLCLIACVSACKSRIDAPISVNLYAAKFC